MSALLRTLSVFGLVCAAFWGALPAHAGPPPASSGALTEGKEQKSDESNPLPGAEAEGKEEKRDEPSRFLQAQSETMLRSIAAHGLMTPLELQKHGFSLRSADGAGDLRAPHLDGIDFMSINFAPVGFGGQGLEEVLNEALFSSIGGIFPVTAERSFRMELPSLEAALGLMEKRMQANVVLILRTDSKADQIAKLTGSVHWGEFVLEGGIPAEDLRYLLAPARLFAMVSNIFKDLPGLTLIPVEDTEIPLSHFELSLALDPIKVPGAAYNRGAQQMRALRSKPGQAGTQLTLPDYRRHLDALFKGPLKDKPFFEYAVRLPILEDMPFLRD